MNAMCRKNVFTRPSSCQSHFTKFLRNDETLSASTITEWWRVGVTSEWLKENPMLCKYVSLERWNISMNTSKKKNRHMLYIWCVSMACFPNNHILTSRSTAKNYVQIQSVILHVWDVFIEISTLLALLSIKYHLFVSNHLTLET